MYRETTVDNCVFIDEIILDVQGFADDLSIWGENKESVVQNTTAMINEAQKKKRKRASDKWWENRSYIVMETATSENENFVIKNCVFKKT